ncbi:MAG: caspase family protein [Deltaproteobacteria bacterium]|nr:caspase family protein [Deltaproteobacteria bacterium]
MRLAASLLVALLWCGAARAATHAVVIGYNSPPVDADAKLAPLRFADDDAARFFELFQRMRARVVLLSVFDERTQRRYPEATREATEPTLENLRRAMAVLREAMAQERDRGEEVRFFLTYSGHGARSKSGKAFLTLSDGELTEEILFDELLKDLPARTSHLIFDACNAGAVVGARGDFGLELNASAVPVGNEEIVHGSRFEQFPSLGAILSSAAGNESHEWSRVESGVFTHEILSALSGAADINRDRVIEYSEVQAFVASANSALTDPRARSEVVVRPPKINQRAPLVSLDGLERVSYLRGSPGRLGRFFVELENGERYLDAHLASNVEATLVLPAGGVAFVRADRGEAVLRLVPGTSATFGDLSFREAEARERGSIERSFHDQLFAAAYDANYYRGFVDRAGALSVDFSASSVPSVTTSPSPVLHLSFLGVAGAFLISTGVATAVALNARSDLSSTDLQRPASELAARYQIASGVAVASAAAGLVSGLCAWLFWPEDLP